MDTDNSVMMARRKGEQQLGERGQSGDMCNSVNNKNIGKKISKSKSDFLYFQKWSATIYFSILMCPLKLSSLISVTPISYYYFFHNLNNSSPYSGNALLKFYVGLTKVWIHKSNWKVTFFFISNINNFKPG